MTATERGGRGIQGERGERGATGPAGVTGAGAPYLGRSQTLALFAFVVVAFLLLAYRTEVNTSNIRQGVHEACMQRADIDRVTSDCERFR
ncbi:MAG TPA: collagen-like protein [Plantibacter sp.]|uniref:collagen-like triple helix repeat-containing protein n=1 Tax=Plantibacter sp. TaxID=1871045 RepID=UPI002C92F935|nr:collagen-like protein [Plantibacter sp.]